MRLFVLLGALCLVLFSCSEVSARRMKNLPVVQPAHTIFGIFQPPLQLAQQRPAPQRHSKKRVWVSTVFGERRVTEVGPRPGRWCGWFMQVDTGVTSRGTGLNLNRAIEWSRVGHPASPGIGTIVVWRHHVGKIVGQTDKGQWIVRSGNDGRRVRERPRSIANAVAFRSI